MSTLVSQQYNFLITGDGEVSRAFLQKRIGDFLEALAFIKELPYGRNKNKENPLTVFTDGCGTCSTKHALLKQLADEHNTADIQLILCVFKMSRENTPPIKEVLDKYKLPYMPEAHNYLRLGGAIVDCTKKHWSITQFPEDVLEEREIEATGITGFKVNYHKKFLENWLLQHPELSYSPDELYGIREKCIETLGSKN